MRVAKNASVLLSGNLLNKVLSFLMGILLANYLGPEGYGKYAYAFALVTLFVFVPDLGIPQLTIKEVAREKGLANKYLMNSIFLRGIISLLVVGVLIGVALLLEDSRETIYLVALISLSLIFISISNSFEVICSAFERMQYTAFMSNLKNILLLAGVGLIIFLRKGLIEVGVLYLTTCALVAGLFYLVLRSRIIKPKLEVDLKFWKSLVKKGLPFALAGIFFTVYFKIDSVMLRFISGNEEVGLYNAAYNLIYALSFIPASITAAIFPRLSEDYIYDRGSLRLGVEKSLKYLLVISLPLAVGGSLLSRSIILTIYHRSYLLSAVIFQILILSLVLIWMNVCMFVSLNSVDRQTVVTKISGAGCLFNIGLNSFMIPLWGARGAAMATLLTEVALLTISFYYFSKYILRPHLTPLLSRPLIAVALMSPVTLYLRSSPLWLTILLSGSVYLLALFLLGGISPEERRLFLEVVGRSREVR